MKIKKLSLLAISALMMVGGLTACGPTAMDPNEAVTAALKNGAIVTHADYQHLSTVQVNTFRGEDADYLVALNQIDVSKDEKNPVLVDLTWSWEAATQGDVTDFDSTKKKLTPVYPDPGDEKDAKVIGKATYKGVEKTQEWSLKLTNVEPDAYRIKDIDDNVALNENVRTYGYITGYYQQTTAEIYSGVFVGDGDSAIMLYAGQLSELWYKEEVAQFAIGDLVKIMGQYAPYNGLREIKPKLLEKIELSEIDPELRPVAPVDFEPTEWTATSTAGNDCRIINMQDIEITSVPTLTPGKNHWSIGARYKGQTLAIYVNYHIGTTKQQSLIDGNYFVVGNHIDIEGWVVGWYTKEGTIGAQISLLQDSVTSITVA